MKKILAILAAPVMLGLMISPASADQAVATKSGGDFCGPSYVRYAYVNTWQIRRDSGTPSNYSDDDINFSGNWISDDIISGVGPDDKADLDHRHVEIIKHTNDGPEVFWERTSNNNSNKEISWEAPNEWISVGKTPIVKIKTVWNGGATCEAKAGWLDSWE